MKEAQELLEQGLPPSDDAEHEWYRMERERVRRQQQLLDSSANSAMNVSGGLGSMGTDKAKVRTTAEPRPNAYIPDELGIPRPYGVNAPFKPTVPGSTMRHVQKPKIREIVI